MVKFLELLLYISISLGIIADTIFMVLFFWIPLVKRSPGLKFIMIGIIFNIISLIDQIVILILGTGRINHYTEIIVFSIYMYAYITQNNCTIIYNFYLYQIICKKIEIKSEFVKKIISCEISLTVVLIAGLTVVQIIDSKTGSFWVILIIICIYSIFCIICVKLSFSIYLELKNKYLDLKQQAIYDLARLISFPLSMGTSVCLFAVYTFYNSSKEIFYAFYCVVSMNGVLMLLCLLITREMKDGIKLMRFNKSRLVSAEYEL